MKFRSARISKFSLLLISIILGVSYGPGRATGPEGSPDIPDIGTFMKIKINQRPQVAGVTARLFFVGNASGTKQVYRMNEVGWPYQLTVFDDGIDWFKLSYDGTKAIVGASTGGSEQSQLFLMNTELGQLTQLTNNPDIRYGSVFWKKDGGGFYYRANSETPGDFKIFSHDLSAGTDTKIFDMPGSNSIADISYDENFMLIYHYESNVINDLYLLNLGTGEHREITPAGDENEYDYPWISRDNRRVYVITNNNPDGVRRLATIDIASGDINFIKPDTRWGTDRLSLSDDRRYMVWLLNEEGYSRMLMRDVEKGRDIPVPVMDGIIEDLFVTDAGRVYFTFDNPTRTQDIWYWDWNKPELRKMTYACYAGIDRSIFHEPLLIKYRSFDGLEIPAFLYLPPGYDGSPIPFIISAHGGPESQYRPYFVRNFQYFLLNGFGILAPNIRGSTGYGMEYVNLDNYGNRLNSIKDIKAGVEYLISGGYAEKGHIGIVGGSYGGYVVLASITEYPDLFAAAVDRVGIANYETFLENTKDYRRHIREAEYGPLSDRAFLESISPIHKADRIKTPLLVIHGENDTRVPVGEARQIIRAIEDQGGIVDSLIFPDEGHVIGKLSNRIEIYRKTVEFFEKYLK